jgi:acyl-[acyl-carrier-protein]-phospholipid O-acyltransferase / long-chain-fatty-acid--[acyl-carrier-protein] ligase
VTVTVTDRAKGEQIVLVTDVAGARRLDLVAWVQNHGVSELAVPRRIIVIDALPVLGTGKTDYVSVQKLAEREPD